MRQWSSLFIHFLSCWYWWTACLEHWEWVEGRTQERPLEKMELVRPREWNLGATVHGALHPRAGGWMFKHWGCGVWLDNSFTNHPGPWQGHWVLHDFCGTVRLRWTKLVPYGRSAPGTDVCWRLQMSHPSCLNMLCLNMQWFNKLFI